MPCYIANHQKKNRIFAKRQRELAHAIKNDFPAEKLFIAAEKVRSAKISVFKCRFAQTSVAQAHKFSLEETADNNKEVERWLSMTADEIVDLYRSDET